MALIGLSPGLAPRLVQRLATEHRHAILSPAWPPAQGHESLGLVIAEDGDPAALTLTVRRSTAAPLLIVTTASTRERVRGLEQGADVCLARGDDLAIVEAHAIALLRRDHRSSRPADRLELGRVVLEVDGRNASVAGRTILLSRREFDLLAHLMRQPGRVFRRHDLLAAVWGSRFVGESNTVDVHIAWIRQKVGADCGVRLTTLRGVGYRLDVL